MKKIKITTIALLSGINSVFAQYFDNIYPFNNDVSTNRVAYKNIVAVKQGALVINGLINNNALLTFIGLNGIKQWAVEYELVGFKSGVLMDDGNFLLIGKNMPPAKDLNVAIKIDATNGSVIWKKDYNPLGEYTTEFTDLTRTNEKTENYVFAGYRAKHHADAHNQLYCMKIDGLNGNVIWASEYFDPFSDPSDEIDIPSFIRETPKADQDGEILVAGTRYYPGAETNIFTIVINNNGKIEKKYREFPFGFLASSFVPSVAFADDGGYLIVFDYTASVGAMKLDASDNVSWTYSYKFNSLLENLSGAVFQLKDGSFNISGWGYNSTTSKKYPYIFNIDKNANPMCGTQYIKKGSFQHIAMTPDADDNFLLHSMGVSQSVFSLLKVDANGKNSSCSISETPVQLFTFVNPFKRSYWDWDSKPATDDNTPGTINRLSEDSDCEGKKLDQKQRSATTTGIEESWLTLDQNPSNNGLRFISNSTVEKQAVIEIRTILGQSVYKKETTLRSGIDVYEGDMIQQNKGLLIITVTCPGEAPRSFKILSE